ncbi:hypothetical protein M4A92_15795 [Caldibacillus thermoamylovorans]|jgi:hypothetical protein|uniref:hypothetical protein n=1 Tax=Caldibacillus thermoamylovorans TaxID=35841 RepID=UPI00203D8CB6|nr:hypothetical protein [Caldibacillus thermoamylovorans]MCM3800058.1 hypothetical protein [Caldibacillus thermoamylovorans]
MEIFDETILKKLYEVMDIIDGTLKQKENYTIETTSDKGLTYTHDRENYLQLGLEVVSEELQWVIEEIEERAEKKSRFKVIK